MYIYVFMNVWARSAEFIKKEHEYAGEPVINYHRYEAIGKTINKNSDPSSHASKRNLIAAKLHGQSITRHYLLPFVARN